jgi:hypothetical protein
MVSCFFIVVGLVAYVFAPRIANSFSEKRRASGLYSKTGIFSKKFEEVPPISVRQTATAMIALGILGFVLRYLKSTPNV